MTRALFVVVAFLLVGCSSPEADRARGGGAGADVQNHGATIAIHGDINMFHDTPKKARTP
jgi:hypothetical protein